jgi:hypothetical protein
MRDVDADLDTLATALYVRTDGLLKCCPERAPWRPAVGITPRLSDAELLTLAVMQALLGFVSETRWLRYARKSLRSGFHPGGMRPVEGHRPPLGAGRIRRIRLLPQPLPVFLGLRLHLLTTLHGLPVGFALTAAIWHNDHTTQPVMGSLIAYDHC